MIWRKALLVLPALQKFVVCFGIERPSLRSDAPFLRSEIYRKTCDDLSGNPVLQREDVYHGAVISVGPEMAARARID